MDDWIYKFFTDWMIDSNNKISVIKILKVHTIVICWKWKFLEVLRDKEKNES